MPSSLAIWVNAAATPFAPGILGSPTFTLRVQTAVSTHSMSVCVGLGARCVSRLAFRLVCLDEG